MKNNNNHELDQFTPKIFHRSSFAPIETHAPKKDLPAVSSFGHNHELSLICLPVFRRPVVFIMMGDSHTPSTNTNPPEMLE